MKPDVAQDTSHSAIVTDHDFTPDPAAPWGLCKWAGKEKNCHPCNLSGASHATGPRYEPTAPRAVPDGTH